MYQCLKCTTLKAFKFLSGNSIPCHFLIKINVSAVYTIQALAVKWLDSKVQLLSLLNVVL